MAKSKSSVQENIATRTGIDIVGGLNFRNLAKQAPAVEEALVQEKEDKPEQVSKAEAKTHVEKQAPEKEYSKVRKEESPKEKDEDVVSALLYRKKEEEKHHVNCVITDKAFNNLTEQAKKHGYKKLSPFINAVFENLDKLLKEEMK
jgi:hypothetical protein